MTHKITVVLEVNDDQVVPDWIINSKIHNEETNGVVVKKCIVGDRLEEWEKWRKDFYEKAFNEDRDRFLNSFGYTFDDLVKEMLSFSYPPLAYRFENE